MLTFSDLRTRVTRWLDEATNTATSTTNLVNDAINASHRRVTLMRPWPFMKWPKQETFTSVSGTRSYGLNPNIGRLLYLWDGANKCFVPTIPMRNWREGAVDPTTTSAQYPGATFGGNWPVMRQPDGTNVLRIVSTSASDVTSRTVTIRGTTSDGEIASETITANGTTVVAGTTVFVTVLNVTKNGSWVGTMTLGHGSPITTTLLTLTTSQYGKQYPTIEFTDTPGSAKTYTYAFLRSPQTLSVDNDIPEIPFPFSEILVYDTLLDFATYNSEIGQMHVQLWTKRYEELLKQLTEAYDEAIVGSQPRFVRDIESATYAEYPLY